MSVVQFNGKPPSFSTVMVHLRAAADMLRAMSDDQLGQFWAAAHLNDYNAEDDDLAASLGLHLADWEGEVRDEKRAEEIAGRMAVE